MGKKIIKLQFLVPKNMCFSFFSNFCIFTVFFCHFVDFTLFWGKKFFSTAFSIHLTYIRRGKITFGRKMARTKYTTS